MCVNLNLLFGGETKVYYVTQGV